MNLYSLGYLTSCPVPKYVFRFYTAAGYLSHIVILIGNICI